MPDSCYILRKYNIRDTKYGRFPLPIDPDTQMYFRGKIFHDLEGTPSFLSWDWYKCKSCCQTCTTSALIVVHGTNFMIQSRVGYLVSSLEYLPLFPTLFSRLNTTWNLKMITECTKNLKNSWTGPSGFIKTAAHSARHTNIARCLLWKRDSSAKEAHYCYTLFRVPLRS